MSEPTFTPFYEGGRRWRLGLIGKLFVAAGLGLLFFIPHARAMHWQVVGDWSWLLAVLITTAMLALYYATDTLRGLLPGMSLRLRAKDGRYRDAVFMDPLRKWLADPAFVAFGVFIGALNAGIGCWFGIPDVGSPAFYTTLFGFFLAGFVCGMAMLGIIGVTVAISRFAKEAGDTFDYTAPDRCGGVQFIGEGLVVFSSVTLIVGVMISVYVRAFPWTHHGPGVLLLQWIWIALPYALSLLVLIWPAVPLNDALRRYKLREEERLLGEVAGIKRKLDGNPDAGAKKELRDDYAFEQKTRENLHAMGTWPHGMSANLKYIGIFAVNLLASASTASSLLGKLNW